MRKKYKGIIKYYSVDIMIFMYSVQTNQDQATNPD